MQRLQKVWRVSFWLKGHSGWATLLVSLDSSQSTGAMWALMHRKKVQRIVDVFEHTQVMLQPIPSIRDPGIPQICRELCPLEQDKRLGPDPAAGFYQDPHVPDTSMTMDKHAYGEFSSPWSCLDSRPLWKKKWSLKMPCSLCQLPKDSSHPSPLGSPFLLLLHWGLCCQPAQQTPACFPKII